KAPENFSLTLLKQKRGTLQNPGYMDHYFTFHDAKLGGGKAQAWSICQTLTPMFTTTGWTHDLTSDSTKLTGEFLAIDKLLEGEEYKEPKEGEKRPHIPSKFYFEYGTNKNELDKKTKVTEGNGEDLSATTPDNVTVEKNGLVSVEEDLHDLEPGTQYYYR